MRDLNVTTIGGARIDISFSNPDNESTEAHATCGGCDTFHELTHTAANTKPGQGTDTSVRLAIVDWANEHAAACRFSPSRY